MKTLGASLLVVVLALVNLAFGEEPPTLVVTPVDECGCTASTLGSVKHQFWSLANNAPGQTGWRILVDIEADDSRHHLASINETMRDEHGWVVGYKGREGTSWKIDVEDGWEVLGVKVIQSNCLLSVPGEKPVKLNVGSGSMVDLYRHWIFDEDGNVGEMTGFTIRQESHNGWWGGSYLEKGADGKPKFGSFMDLDNVPLQNVRLQFLVYRAGE